MTLTVVAVIFGVFAVGLIVLLIYKSTLTMHRDDQLFLDDATSHMHDEDRTVGQGESPYPPGARVRYGVWGISACARGDVDLPKAEPNTVESKV
jgi:hypothetical protein